MITPLRQRMLEELQRRNYCSGTIRLYLRHVAVFAQHFHRSPDEFGAHRFVSINSSSFSKKLAWSTYNRSFVLCDSSTPRLLSVPFCYRTSHSPGRAATSFDPQ